MEVGKQDDGTKHGKKHNKRLNNPGMGRGTSLHHLILCMQPVAPGQRQISPEVRACQDSRPEEQGSSMWLHHGLIPGCDSLLADASLFVTLWPKGVKGAVVLVVAALSACVAFPFICFTVSVLRRISNTFCMAIICLLGPLSTLTYHFHSLEKCSTVSPFALSFLLCFNNLSQHVAGRCPSYSTLFTASVAVVLSAPLTTHGHSVLVCGVWRTCNVNMTTPTRRPLPTYVMSSHASTVQLS